MRPPNIGLPDRPNPWQGLTPAQAFRARQMATGGGVSKERLTSLERPKLAPSRCTPMKATAPMPAYRPYMPSDTVPVPGHRPYMPLETASAPEHRPYIATEAVHATGYRPYLPQAEAAHSAHARAAILATNNREALKFNALERHMQTGQARIERKKEIGSMPQMTAPTKPVRLPPINHKTAVPAMMFAHPEVRPATFNAPPPPAAVYSPPPRQIMYTREQLPAHFADSMTRHSRPLPNIGEPFIPSPVPLPVPRLDLSGLRLGEGDNDYSPKKPVPTGGPISGHLSPNLNAANSTAMFWGRDDNASPPFAANAASLVRDRLNSPVGYNESSKSFNTNGVIHTYANADVNSLGRLSPAVLDVTPPGRERYSTPSHRSDASGRSNRSPRLDFDMNSASLSPGSYSPISSMGDFHDSESDDDFYDNDESEEEEIIVPHPPVLPRPPESEKPSFIRRIFRRN